MDVIESSCPLSLIALPPTYSSREWLLHREWLTTQFDLLHSPFLSPLHLTNTHSTLHLVQR